MEREYLKLDEAREGGDGGSARPWHGPAGDVELMQFVDSAIDHAREA
jgi:hypothetical protein